RPALEIEFPLGEGTEDICTAEEAGGIRVSHTDAGQKWTCVKTIGDSKLVVTLSPEGPPEYPINAEFAFGGITTGNPQGSATVSFYITNFREIANTSAFRLMHKRYPVLIKEFKADPNPIVLGGKTNLSWEVENAQQGIDAIHIIGLGRVLPKETREVQIDHPVTFTMAAKDCKDGTVFGDCAVGLVKPSIISFEAEPKYFYGDDKITLTWGTASASSVSFSPSVPGTPDINGSAEVSPGESTAYTITASGFDGVNLASAQDLVKVWKTPWKSEGNADLASDTSTAFTRRLYGYGNKLIHYTNGKLYESADGVNFAAIEKSELPNGVSGKNATTMLWGDDFYVLGGEAADFSSAARFNLKELKWETETSYLKSSSLGQSAWGYLTDAYHAALFSNGRVSVASRDSMGVWSAEYSSRLNGADAIEIAVFRRNLYLAARIPGRNVISISYMYQDDWVECGNIRHNGSEWFSFICNVNAMYVINGQGIWGDNGWKMINPLFPGDTVSEPPLTGIFNNRLYIIKDGKAVWSYDLLR
ncbi:MAG: hypothetical protein FWE00_08195, partial [Defluviitaleaceae bacterium]|nr:hypothetical protein [Defluviitaleaceae bacterium]